MNKITVQPDCAEQIRRSDGPIELVDAQGSRVGVPVYATVPVSLSNGWQNHKGAE